MAVRRKTPTPKTTPEPSVRTPADVPGKRRPGRPPVHDEAWTKVTVVLFNRQVLFLDGMASSIRARSGAAISRAQLIRAFVDAVGDAAVDLTAATSEGDVRSLVHARLGRYRPGSQ